MITHFESLLAAVTGLVDAFYEPLFMGKASLTIRLVPWIAAYVSAVKGKLLSPTLPSNPRFKDT